MHISNFTLNSKTGCMENLHNLYLIGFISITAAFSFYVT